MNRKREVRLPFVPKSGHSPAGPAQRILRRQSGGLARLTKAPGRGGLTRRKGALPYWRNLNTALAKGRPVSEQRLNLWLLVLTAKHMPHRLIGAGGSPRLYVPCLYEGLALHDIRAVEQERSAPLFVPPAHDNAPWVLAFLLLLFVWHGLRFQWFGALLPAPPFPATPGLWPALFGLDMPRFREAHEIWRAVTALTLHADDAHLFGNLGFGFVFLTALCRRAGFGLGLFLTLLGGISGNSANALLQPLTDYLNPMRHGEIRQVLSMGFSTALFASVGALCALNISDMLGHQKRFAHLQQGRGKWWPVLLKRLVLPFAAGLALLGILGGGGEAKTDYAAHIWGFFCGLAVTFATLPLKRLVFTLPAGPQKKAQGLLAALTLALLCLCWLYALLN